MSRRITFQKMNVLSAVRPRSKMTAEHEAGRRHLGVTSEQCAQLLNNLHGKFSVLEKAVSSLFTISQTLYNVQLNLSVHRRESIHAHKYTT